ncbi:MAG TPA: hypothetical protein VGG40_11110 [Solirubrobacterales bacterium]|jgi:hypothetical protein
MPAEATGDEAAEADLAQLLALAATLSEHELEGVEPVSGPQEW